ncbi:MAG: Gfo/Idh/MocA family oxidoreductase [Colwellia sp.]|nr:Gfo/Idh/MocA family oxidoreductase [Colwellia sp.]
MQQRKVRLGMVGGGEGAFIGGIHRLAAQMDGQIELVCGAFSSKPDKAKAFGKTLFLADLRCYTSYQEMFALEAKLPCAERMDMVAIVTPNHLHFPVAKMALEYGFHVISDKPATLTLSQAIELKAIIQKACLLYGLTHTYTGYPMVKEAKYRIEQGQLGQIKKIIVEYPQGWLANKNDENSKQASWRLDPKQAGISCCMADIGIHAANLAEYVTGLKISSLCAELTSNVADRLLDDDGTVLLRFDSGAHGVLLASQVCVGEENSLKLRVYGEHASIEWSQLEPNSLWLKFPHQPSQLIRSGVGQMAVDTQASLRTPAGHPEGYLEAFANIYLQFAKQVRNHGKPCAENTDIPGIDEAIRGMAFIENVVAASKSEFKWHNFSLIPADIKPRTTEPKPIDPSKTEPRASKALTSTNKEVTHEQN